MIPCRRCLLSAVGDARLLQTVQAYIQAIPPELRTDTTHYEQRLAACQACDHLINGLCIKCGCYVELRCAKSALYCPDLPPRW